MKRRRISAGWTKVIFTCCKGQCAFDAINFLHGSNFEVSGMSKLYTFKVKLPKKEVVALLNMAGCTNDREQQGQRHRVYQAGER